MSHINTEELRQSIQSLCTSKTGAVSIKIYQDGKVTEGIGGNKVEDLIPQLLALIDQALHQQREELKTEILEMKRTVYYSKDNTFIDYEAEEYNTAIDQVINSLSSPKEETSKEEEKPKSELVTWRYPKKATKTIHKDGISQIIEGK